MSADTIAIVFSVIIGVCGYLLQAWTADRANRHAATLQREHDKEARKLQVEHDRAQAQVRRTERWVDDCCTPLNRAVGEYSFSRYRFSSTSKHVLQLLILYPFGEQAGFTRDRFPSTISVLSAAC